MTNILIRMPVGINEDTYIEGKRTRDEKGHQTETASSKTPTPNLSFTITNLQYSRA